MNFFRNLYVYFHNLYHRDHLTSAYQTTVIHMLKDIADYTGELVVLAKAEERRQHAEAVRRGHARA